MQITSYCKGGIKGGNTQCDEHELCNNINCSADLILQIQSVVHVSLTYDGKDFMYGCIIFRNIFCVTVTC